MDELKCVNTGAGEPLKVNVYDVASMNGYMYWFGLGVYHSAIEAYGTEYAYGAHDYPSSGVFEVAPEKCPGFKFRKSITLGTIWLDPEEFHVLIEELACEYTGISYNLLRKNCNHFCDDVCLRLIGSRIPAWINRMARIGTFWSCFLPVALQGDVIDAFEYEDYGVGEDDTKYSQSIYCRLAGTLAAVAPRKRHIMTLSGFPLSYRGGIGWQDWTSGSISRSTSTEILKDVE